MDSEFGRFLICWLLAVTVGCGGPAPVPEAATQISVTATKPAPIAKTPESAAAKRLAAEEEAEKAMSALDRFDRPLPLQNIPVITQLKHSIVAVKNVGASTLLYLGWRRPFIKQWQEVDSGGWREGDNSSFRCGVFPPRQFELPPGKTAYIRIEFFNSKKRERMWGFFREKGTARQDRVILATEPKL